MEDRKQMIHISEPGYFTKEDLPLFLKEPELGTTIISTSLSSDEFWSMYLRQLFRHSGWKRNLECKKPTTIEDL